MSGIPEPLRELVVRRLGAESRIVALSGDASSRRYFRVFAGESRAVGAVYPAPFSCVEEPFIEIRGLLSSWGVPVPRVLDCDGPHGAMLLEDLGDQTLQRAVEGGLAPEERRGLYREALRQLAAFQRASGESGSTGSCFRVAFDVEKLSWELHYFEKHFLEGLRGARLSVEDRSTLALGFLRLSEELASWPRVLCHRDFHSRNLMLHRGTLYWIDFQDARLGPVAYDVVSLLRDSYVELDEDLVEELGEEFRQSAVPAVSRETFGRQLALTAVQRNLKALGTFGYHATVRGNSVYLPYVPRTLASAGEQLARQPELAPLRRVLASHIEELS
jgi:aminoglycoside/choline kinase family phosphotransferase